MNREEVRTYIHLCKEANIPASSILNALVKKASILSGIKDAISAGAKATGDAAKLLGAPSIKLTGKDGSNRLGALTLGLGGAATGSAATWYAKDQQLQAVKKEYANVISNLVDRDKKQQKEWLMRGGALGGGIGALIAPLLLKGKNPVLSSLLGAATGSVLGSVGGSIYSNM